MFDDWYVHPVVVRKLTNDDPTSDSQSFAAAVTLMGYVSDSDSVVVRDRTGSEVNSTLKISLPLSAADKVSPGSQIELPESQHPDTFAISVSVADVDDPELDGVTVMCE